MDKKSVIILGKGVTWDQCPFDEEVWTVNDAFLTFDLPRLDKLFFFDKHFIGAWFYPADGFGKERVVDMEYTDNRGIKKEGKMVQMTPELLNDLSKKYNCKVVSFWDFGFNNYEMFPLWKIIKETNSEYFINSIAHMIAYAVYLGYEQIKLYGVDFATEHEVHGGEKGGVEYWIGYARGRGIDVIKSKGALIEERNLYGLNNLK